MDIMDHLYTPVATIVIAWRAWLISGLLVINLLITIYFFRGRIVSKKNEILRTILFSFVPLFLIWIISDVFKVPPKEGMLDWEQLSFPTYVVGLLLLSNFIQAIYRVWINRANLWLFLSLVAIPLWLSAIATFIALMVLNGAWI